MRGRIVDIQADGGGVIEGVDRRIYRFDLDDDVSPRPGRGATVEFVVDGDTASDIVQVWPEGPSIMAAPVSPWGYYVRCLRKYVDGNGRARRREYWWFVLFRVLTVAAFAIPAAVFSGLSMDATGDGVSLLASFFLVLAGIAWVGTMLPNLCVLIRRLHDVGLTGWLVLINAIPYVGPLFIFVICLIPGQAHQNAHGHPPGQAPRATADVFT